MDGDAPLACCRAHPLVETLEWACRSGIVLGILSGYEPEGKLRALRIEQYFPVVVSAQEIAAGRFKPAPRGLLIALERLQVAPENAVYIDYPEGTLWHCWHSFAR